MAKRKGISNGLRWKVLQRDNFTCQYCGRHAPDVALEIDHIIPVAKGGTNDILNLVTACYECNHGKGAKYLVNEALLEKQEETHAHELKKVKEQNDEFLLRREELLRQRKEILELKDEQIKTIFRECFGWPESEIEEYWAEADFGKNSFYAYVEKKVRCRGFKFAYEWFFDTESKKHG